MIKKKAIRKKVIVLNNALETGVLFYGLHMHEGPAHYKDLDATIMLSNSTIKAMNPTFTGKPVYVGHVDEHTDLAQADGVVSESFYNPLDGNHWCKFIVTSEKGLSAVNRGWVLSNSLLVDRKNEIGGQWHGIDYHATVEEGTFHHLAIVPNPRYQQSMILTAEQYKQYNKSKEAELEMLSNSKENAVMKFQVFKKTKVDNSKDINLEEMVVVLPKKKKEVTLAQLVNEADEAKEPSAEPEKLDIDGVKMTLSEFIEMYKKLKAEFDSLEIVESEEAVVSEDAQLSNEADEESEEDEDLDESGDLDEEDEDEDSSEITEEDLDALDAAEAAKEAAKLNNATSTPKKKAVKKGTVAKKLKNAADKAATKLSNSSTVVVDLSSDQIKRGAERYGSKKK